MTANALLPPPNNLAQFKTADDLWNYTSEQVMTVKERELAKDTAQMKKALPFAEAGVADFLLRYPNDKQVWTVRDWKCDLDLISYHLGQAGAPSPGEIADDYEALGRDMSVTERARGIVKAKALLIRIDQARALGAPSEAIPKLSEQVTDYEKEFGPDLKFFNRNYALEVRTHFQYETKPVEMKITAVDGTVIDLSSLRGKVVLIDFWATWCGGCVLEIPKVANAYHQFHSKGLEVVGVSFDQDKEALVNFTKARHMPWPEGFAVKEHGDDFRKTFGIEGIPALWLIARNGMLVTTDAGKDLSTTIEQALGTP